MSNDSLSNYLTKSGDSIIVFESLCRICQIQQESLDVFETVIKNDDVFLHEIYSFVTNLDISEIDGLTNGICLTCCDKLLNAYTLKKQAISSFNTLMESKSNDTKAIDTNSTSNYILLSKSDEHEFDVEQVDELGSITLENTASDAVEFLTNLNSLKVLSNQKKQEVFRPNEKRHECHQCDKKFLRKSNLIDHLRLHENVKLFKCEYCEKSFVQIGNYKSHLRIHTNERPYACWMCTKTYNQSSALKIHIRSHTNERNYICNYCSKSFTNASDLSKHKIVHDPSKQVKCEFCDRCFAQKSNLRNHIKKNHTNDK